MLERAREIRTSSVKASSGKEKIMRRISSLILPTFVLLSASSQLPAQVDISAQLCPALTSKPRASKPESK